MEYHAFLVHYFSPRWILSILFKVTESQNKYERHCEEIRQVHIHLPASPV